MFILVMSYALAGTFGADADRPVRILAVNQDRGDRGAALLSSLDAMDGFEVRTTHRGAITGRLRADELVAQGTYPVALVVHPDYSAQLSSTEEDALAHVTLVVDPSTSSRFISPIQGTVEGLLRRAASETAVEGFEGEMERIEADIDELAHAASHPPPCPAPVPGSPGRVQIQERDPVPADPIEIRPPRPVAVSVVKTAFAGVDVSVYPDTYQQNVPGYTVFGLFWIVNLLAVSVLRERRNGTFRRLLVAPMSRWVILAGKLVPYYIVNLIQVAIMLGLAHLLFGMSLGSSPAGLVAVSMAAALSATGLGVLVAALVRTDAQANSLTVLVLLTLSALGGSFVPRFVMPESLQLAGLVTPHAWAIDAYQDILVRSAGLVDVLPEVGALTAFAVAFFAVGALRFRFS